MPVRADSTVCEQPPLALAAFSLLMTMKSEICYQLRYVERNDHQQGRKWSERQIGVYHSFATAGKEPGVMILLHAMHNSRAQLRFERVFRAGDYHDNSPTSPLRLHLLIFSTYMNEWRWYMDDLGMQCLDIVLRAESTLILLC